MTEKKLNIAFIWHMHQPMYKDPISGEYTLPWVLFHGTKDYYDMVAILDEFPSIHQTFNLVPSLLEQVTEYAEGRASDAYRTLSGRQASALSVADKIFMLRYFFQANWDNMLKPLPRYWELMKKRGPSGSEEDVRPALRYFSEQDFLDLQVLFNLVWIDPWIRGNDPFLSALEKKGGGFTEAEKEGLLARQTDIMKLIIPKYSEMQKKGIIEISTTPYYHPILPLLCDTDVARESMAEIALPSKRFTHPEDAEVQIKKAVEMFKGLFGHAPSGMWPSEGSVSMAMLPLAARAGIKWLATDEEILTNTLKRPIRRDGHGNCIDPFLYKPYSIEVDGSPVSLLFRDHKLSDLIGFEYSRISPDEAAEDLIRRLETIHSSIEDPESHVVSIILDGENAWECYRNDGRDFFTALYSRLSENRRLRCTTVSEFLDKQTAKEKLSWIFPGSWINHNFRIWIGHQEDNTAWDFISEARDALSAFELEAGKGPDDPLLKKKTAEAWEALYAAQGSDWFWWYGDDHSSMLDEHFDSLFRLHIRKIYNLIGIEPPEQLDYPISSAAKGYRPRVQAAAYIHPILDGEISNYFEWLPSGRLDKQHVSGAMHQELQAGGFIAAIAYGFSEENLYLRFDYTKASGEHDWSFAIVFASPRQLKIDAMIKGKAASASASVRSVAKDTWEPAGLDVEIASDTVVEISIPLGMLRASKGDEVRLSIVIDAGIEGMERWPVKGTIILDVPVEGFEQQDWIV